MQALVLGFCSSGYDFAIPSSRLHLTVQTLGITMWFVGNYAHCGLSPQTDGVPVILTKATAAIYSRFLITYIKYKIYLAVNDDGHSCLHNTI